MKLTITTSHLSITYEDDYSKLEEDAKKHIIDIIQSLPYTLNHQPVGMINLPKQSTFVGTVDEFFNKK